MKTINIKKVIREIENKKYRLEIYFPDRSDFGKGIKYMCDCAIQIIKDNIKDEKKET